MLYTERVTPVGRHVAELNYSLAEQAGASRPLTPEYPLRVPAGGAASIRARLARSGNSASTSSSARRKLARKMLAGGALRRILP